MRILLIEDDELIASSLAKAMTDQHYIVDIATDGQIGAELAEAYTYDLILLDVVLPKLNGISLCQRLRAQGNQTPILLLTAQDTTTSRVLGLDAGADDYVTKPFNLQELLARVRALLRRGGSTFTPLLEWRNLQLDPSTCEVTCNGQRLRLTPKEYGLLELFLRNSHRIFSCSALIDHLWSFEEPPTDETVRSHVKGLRQKLKAAGVVDDPLETIYGIGYRLKPAEGRSRRETLDGGKRKRGDRETAQLSESNVITLPDGAKTSTSPISAEIKPDADLIWKQAKESLNRRVKVVEQATTLLLQNQLDEDLRQQAEQEAHRLAGSLGMFGSDEGSQLARAIEPLFTARRALDQTQKQHLLQLVTGLRRELQQMSSNDDVSVWLSTQPPTNEYPQLLIVHTDSELAAALAAEAASRGLRSQIAATPAIAQEQLAGYRPDAVLLNLPVQHKQGRTSPAPDALALLAELNSYTPPIPAIVLTGQEQLTDRVKITRLGGRRVVPASAAPSQVLEVVTRMLQHTRTAETRVMVMDDDPQVLVALQRLLEPWGMKVVTLDNPLRFLEVLEAAAPDLLVLDVEMPHVNGIELCQVVRNDSHWSGLPILFLTAHTDAETMHRVFTAGADDFVTKPVIGPELVTRILNRLERSRLLRSLAETDALTEVANRRQSTQKLTQLLNWSHQHQQSFCLAILDLDDLRLVNYQYGYAAGDQVLFQIGKLLRQTFHSEDVVGRWGGTEFVIGMAGVTRDEGIERLSEVVNQVRQMEFTVAQSEPFRVTCSASIVHRDATIADLQALYRAADGALNQAKAAGGDRVVSC